MLEEPIKEQINDFTGLLSELHEYKEFQKAIKIHNNNLDVRNMRIEFGALRKKYSGQHSLPESDIQQLESLQNKIDNHPAVKNLFAKQKELVKIFKECNTLISKSIGVDFVSNAASSCCG